MFVKLGGGKINSKLFLSVLLFCSLALVLNVSTTSAASVNQTNASTSATYLDHTSLDIVHPITQPIIQILIQIMITKMLQ